jgi:hypothetical protein
VRVGKRRRYRFAVSYVEDGRRFRAPRRILIRFAHHRLRTNRRGRAAITLRLGRRGLRGVRVSGSGFRPGKSRVRVLRRR